MKVTVFRLVICILILAINQIQAQDSIVALSDECVSKLVDEGITNLSLDGHLYLFEDFTFSDPDPSRIIDGYASSVFELFNNYFKQSGITLILVPIPPRPILFGENAFASNSNFDTIAVLRDYYLFLEQLSDKDIIAVDLFEVLQDRSKVETTMALETHWTPEGAELSAELVANEIRSQAAISYFQVPKISFFTEQLSALDRNSRLKQRVESTCGVEIPNEVVNQYQTTALSSSEDLFSDVPLPEVVLIGTSYSAGQFNFSGFLKEKLSTDLLDFSSAGGRLFGSLHGYLQVNSLQENPPKILIWEFPYRVLDDVIRYNNVLPLLVRGLSCVDELSTELKLQRSLSDQSSNRLFFSASRKHPLQAEFNYLYISSNTPLEDFMISLKYSAGFEEYRYLHNGRVENIGEYYFYLSRREVDQLEEIQVITKKGLEDTKMNFKLCSVSQ